MGEVFSSRKMPKRETVNPEQDFKIVGLDVSLTASGICVMELNGNYRTTTIPSKPHQYEMLRYISVKERILEFCNIGPNDICVVEDYAFAKQQGKQLNLAETCGIVKYGLHKECGLPIRQLWKVAPAQLKKFATGKGQCPKQLVMKEVLKHWGQDFDDDNECDAWVLARIAFNIVNGIQDTEAHRREVVEAVSAKFPFEHISRSKITS